MTTIFNLTQHNPTPEQIEAGVYNTINHAEVQALITFEDIPSFEEMTRRAYALLSLVDASANELDIERKDVSVMIGGAPFFMRILHKVMLRYGITVLYAFSKRVSVDHTNPDGTIEKISVFKHEGFVTV